MSDHTASAPHDDELAGRLSSERPAPGAGFRGALARRLADEDLGYGPRPAHLYRSALALLAGGGVLMAIGAVISLGAS